MPQGQPYNRDQLFELVQKLRQPQSSPMSYQEWLAARGGGNPYAPVPPPQQQVDYSKLISSLGEKAADKATDGGGSGLLDKLFGGGTTAAANSSTAAGTGLAADAGANAAYNAAAMEAGGAPMTLAEPSLAGSAAPGAFSLSGIGGAGNAILPIAGALGAYDIFANNRGPARGGLQGAASGAALGSWFGPTGALIGAGVGGLGGLVKGLFNHESTRDVAKRHTKELQNQFQDDATYQAYVRGMREQHNSAPPDPTHPFGDTKGNKYRTWDEYKKAGLDAGNLTGVFGNLDTFKNDWTKLNYDQQKAVVQGLIDADLYKSKKGEVVITDKNRAKQIFSDAAQRGFQMPAQTAPPPGQQVSIQPVGAPVPLKVNGPIPSAAPTPGINLKAATPAPAPIMIPRSRTLSPGIDLNGNRINYGRR